MKRIEMGPLTTVWRERTLLLPGGWQAVVPEVKADARSMEAFVRYLESDGISKMGARQRAMETIQAVFESGYMKGLRSMLYARAKEYAQRWPELVTEDGRLLGFDPATLQSAYFPFERTGRRGKNFVDGMLIRMAEDGRKNLEDSRRSGDTSRDDE